MSKKLLYFGADFLTVNLIKGDEYKSKLKGVFDSLFAIPHDDDNASTLFEYDFFGEVFTVDFRTIKKGEVAIFLRENFPVFEIQKISSKWAENIKFKYLYRIEFKGMFFMLGHQKIFPVDSFIKSIFNMKNRDYSLSTSRLDITADIANITTKQIFAGVPTTRKTSAIGTDTKTQETETFYVGNIMKSKNDRQLIRIYNKLNELIAKNSTGSIS